MPGKHTNLESLQVKIEVGKSTHKGMVRTHNEDSVMSIEPTTDTKRDDQKNVEKYKRSEYEFDSNYWKR